MGTVDYTLRSATSFLRAPEIEGLATGERFIQLAARFLGPIFLALAFFAIRNKVKR